MHPETQHLLTVLKTAIRVLGLSVREVERRMGLSPGYLNRLLAGKVELRVDHVCSIARAIGLEPVELFQAAFSMAAVAPSDAARSLRQAVVPFSPAGATPGGPQPPTPSAEEIEQLMDRTLRRLFRELGREQEPKSN